MSERDLHGALLDARLLAEVYLELRGGKQFSMNLAKNKQEMNKALNNKTSNQKKIIKFAALKEDVDLHKMMVSGIKQAVWKKYTY